MPKRIYSECQIPDCGKPHYGHGFCMMHWKRWRRWGDPLVTHKGKRIHTDEERFWQKVLKTNSCWLWTASLSRTGHGNFSTNGQIGRAHRFSYELHRGAVPDGLLVLHDCGNAACVNPAHLYVGTQLRNMQDRDRHGTTARGERAGRARLTAEQVAEIRMRYDLGTVSMQQLANEYGVGQTTVRSAIRGFTYN